MRKSYQCLLSVVFLFFPTVSLHADHLKESQTEEVGFFTNFVFNPLQRTAAKTAAKLLALTLADIAKLCIKNVLNQMIAHKTYCHCYSVSLTSTHFIDYGCEAAWAGVFDGVDAVPYHLMRYASVDTCYYHLEKAAALCALEYPPVIKNNGYMYMLAHIVVPLVCKRGLMYCADWMVDCIMGNDSENESEDSYISS